MGIRSTNRQEGISLFIDKRVCFGCEAQYMVLSEPYSFSNCTSVAYKKKNQKVCRKISSLELKFDSTLVSYIVLNNINVLSHNQD